MNRWLLIGSVVLACSCSGGSSNQRAAPQISDATRQVDAEPAPEQPNVDISEATTSSMVGVTIAFATARRVSAQVGQLVPRGAMTADPGGGELTKAVRPKKGKDGCVTTEEWNQFNQTLAANHKVREYRLAEAKGWRRMIDVRHIRDSSDDHDIDIFGGELARVRDGGFIDPLGNHWLLVDRGSYCGPPRSDVYIDEDSKVFLVQPDYGACKRKRGIKICGKLGIHGCGHHPEELRVYARVPSDAKLVAPRSVRLPDRTCYQARPENGVSRPG